MGTICDNIRKYDDELLAWVFWAAAQILEHDQQHEAASVCRFALDAWGDVNDGGFWFQQSSLKLLGVTLPLICSDEHKDLQNLCVEMIEQVAHLQSVNSSVR